MLIGRAAELAELGRTLDAAGAAIVLGAPGTGKTTLVLQAAQSWVARTPGAGLVRAVADPITRNLPGGALAGLLPERETTLGPSRVAARLAQALRARHRTPVLVLDDAHELDVHGEQVLDLVVRAGGIRVLFTAQVDAVPEIPRLYRSRRDPWLHAVEIGTPEDGPIADAAQAFAALPDGARHAAQVLAANGPMLAARLAEITGPAGVLALRDAGLLGRDQQRVHLEGARLGAAVRAGLDRDRRLELFATITAARPGRPEKWEGSTLRAHVLLADTCGATLPLDQLRRAWTEARAVGLYRFLAVVTTAVLAHPDADDALRLRALTERAEDHHALGEHGAATTDLASAVELAAATGWAHPVERTAITVAQARHQQFAYDDPAAALATVNAARAAVADLPPDRRATALARLDAAEATTLGYAGAPDALPALRAVLRHPAERAEVVPAVAPYMILSVQAGDHDGAKRGSLRWFTTAASHQAENPSGPGEVAAASIFVDLVGGKPDSAARTQAQLTQAVEGSRHELPPIDIALNRAGSGMVALARGQWREAVAALGPAVSRHEVRDPYGLGGYLLASYALALAATGDHATAATAEADARAAVRGATRMIEPYTSWQLLMGRIWRGLDVADEALEIADLAHGRGLWLVELYARHAHGLLRGTALTRAELRAADDAAAKVNAPLGPGLLQHLHELADGAPRLGGTGARLLARAGVVVPHRGGGTLTERERDIAVGAALGMSSRSLAQFLEITTRTVESHLGNAYTKLGVSAREELPEALDRPR